MNFPIVKTIPRATIPVDVGEYLLNEKQEQKIKITLDQESINSPQLAVFVFSLASLLATVN